MITSSPTPALVLAALLGLLCQPLWAQGEASPPPNEQGQQEPQAPPAEQEPQAPPAEREPQAPAEREPQPPAEQEDDDPDYDDGMPRFRLELGLTGYAFMVSQMKAGHQGTATAFDPFADSGASLQPSAAVAAYVDFKVFEWASIGAMYWAYRTSGPKRRIDKDGIGLDTTSFPGRTLLRTTVEIQHLEVTLRYVWFHTQRTHLWFGIGGSWFSHRVTLRPPGAPGASERLEAVFAPALTYSVAANLPGSPLRIHLSSAIAVSYSQWPSVVTWSRFGVRYRLSEVFELTCSLSTRNGFISKEKGITRYDVTSGYRHQRVRWSAIGLEVGVAFSY